MKYHILSFDGGGIRGILTARLLQLIDKELPIIDKIDLFVGTSTGAIIACALANNIPIQTIIDLYVENGHMICPSSLVGKIKSVGGLVKSKYGSNNLHNLLLEIFHNTKLKDLSKKILISSFLLDSTNPYIKNNDQNRAWHPKFFHNYDYSTDDMELVVDVILRATGAPIFFPVYQGFIDGAVAVNNPSVCGLTQAIKYANKKIDEISLLSISTGGKPAFIDYTKTKLKSDWGLLQWKTSLLDILMDSGVEIPDFQCKQILQDNYLRLNPMLEQVIPLDASDFSSIQTLLRTAEQYYKDNHNSILDWIKTQYE